MDAFEHGLEFVMVAGNTPSGSGGRVICQVARLVLGFPRLSALVMRLCARVGCGLARDALGLEDSDAVAVEGAVTGPPVQIGGLSCIGIACHVSLSCAPPPWTVQPWNDAASSPRWPR